MSEATKILPTVRDFAAACAFIDLLIGWEFVGAADDGPVERLVSPRVRAHLDAALGSLCPGYAGGKKLDHPEFNALAAYLRSVADAINPAGAPKRETADVAALIHAFTEGLGEKAHAAMMGGAVPIQTVYALIAEALNAGAEAVLLDRLGGSAGVHVVQQVGEVIGDIQVELNLGHVIDAGDITGLSVEDRPAVGVLANVVAGCHVESMSDAPHDGQSSEGALSLSVGLNSVAHPMSVFDVGTDHRGERRPSATSNAEGR